MDKVGCLGLSLLSNLGTDRYYLQGKWRAYASPEHIESRLDQISTEDPIPAATDPFLSIPSSSSSSPSLISSLPSFPPSPPQQARTRLPSPIPCSLVFPPSPLPLPYPLILPSPPPFFRHLSPSPSYGPLPFLQGVNVPRPPASTSKRSGSMKRDGRRFKPNPHKMDYLRLRSGVKWRLKDLGFEKRPAPRSRSPLLPAVSIQPDLVRPVPTMIGPIPALLWSANVFCPAPLGSVALAPRRNDLMTTLEFLC